MDGEPVSKEQIAIKNGKGPSEYLPRINQQAYCTEFLFNAQFYNLSITQADWDVIEEFVKYSNYFDLLPGTTNRYK